MLASTITRGYEITNWHPKNWFSDSIVHLCIYIIYKVEFLKGYVIHFVYITLRIGEVETGKPVRLDWMREKSLNQVKTDVRFSYRLCIQLTISTNIYTHVYSLLLSLNNAHIIYFPSQLYISVLIKTGHNIKNK